LGHMNYHTVVNMATSFLLSGMPVDTSSAPPKCDHCILRKQTRSSVPKVCVGDKASRKWELVYADVMGPCDGTGCGNSIKASMV
ncbi:uncharacterized protein LAESUDRAFT_665875, partial [Laetiporus sulphureus 93-53]